MNNPDIATRWKLGQLVFADKLRNSLIMTLPNFYASLVMFFRANYLERFNEIDVHIHIKRKGKKYEYTIVENGVKTFDGKV